MRVVAGATSGIALIPAGTSNTCSHAWAITLDHGPSRTWANRVEIEFVSTVGSRLGACLVEDAVDDAPVLHVAGQEAER